VELIAFSKFLESLKDFFGFTDWLHLFLILCLLERIILFGAILYVVSDEMAFSLQKHMIMCKTVG